MNFRRHFYLEKRRVVALLLLILLLCFLYFIHHWFKEKDRDRGERMMIEKVDDSIFVPRLEAFDPNEYTPIEWRALGFTQKQVNTIMKYKEVLGGKFTSKSQIKKCYAISEEKYFQLEPFLLLPDTEHRAENSSFTASSQNQRKKILLNRKFNPDDLSFEDWVRMGFSEAQAKSLLKYKGYLGGSFQSKEKFKESFVISDVVYKQLEPYLLLPEKSIKKTKETNVFEIHPFDPNILDVNGWKSLGFTEKQALSILKYKNNYLKGSFRSLEDIEKNFILKDKFENLRPYIRLNSETMLPAVQSPSIAISDIATHNISLESSKDEEKINFSQLDINQMTVKEFKSFGFSEKNALGIVGFRKALGGFVNKNQIFETYGIDREKAEKLISVAPLKVDEVQKYTLMDAPESWLKTHPYFKYHADKIIYYRISHNSEKKIWKTLKVKPEQEAKMKMYLR